MRVRRAVLLSMLPTLAFAEVSDKMPAISHILLQGGFASAVLFTLCRFRWWFVGLGLPIALWFIAGTIALWLEVPMREALLQEQGTVYFASAFIADLLVITGTVIGAFLGWRQRNAAQQNLSADAPEAARR